MFLFGGSAMGGLFSTIPPEGPSPPDELDEAWKNIRNRGMINQYTLEYVTECIENEFQHKTTTLHCAVQRTRSAGLIFGHREKKSRENNSKLKKITQDFGIFEVNLWYEMFHLLYFWRKYAWKVPKIKQKSKTTFKIIFRSQNSSHFLQNSKKPQNSRIKLKNSASH